MTKTSNFKNRYIPVLLAIAALLWQSYGDLPTKEITSNNIYGFAGNKDTLWMVTDQGVNYTIATSDTLSWFGYKASLGVLSFSFGAKTALLCLDSTAYMSPNKFWYYSHSTGKFDTVGLTFKKKLVTPLFADSALYYANGSAYANGYFWLSCNDGGLVRVDPATRAMRAFYPGVNKSFDPATVALNALQGFDTTKAYESSRRIIGVSVQAVAKDTLAILAYSEKYIFRFFPSDTLWDTLPVTFSLQGLGLESFRTVFSAKHSSTVFASIKTVQNSSPVLFKLRNGNWDAFDSSVSSVTIGADSAVYVVIDNKRIKKYKGLVTDDKATNDFITRISVASASNNPESINDVLYLPQTDSTGSFFLASSSQRNPTWNGLYFSRHEEGDEIANEPFVYVRREKKINSGLKESFAVPGILTADPSNSSGKTSTVFAYSLSKESDVSISIYDWNMDLVKNVIVNKHRSAGKDDLLGNGRSTNRAEDVWDGTNSAGRKVAVGVYYYRITAKSGERAFGKIIVAK